MNLRNSTFEAQATMSSYTDTTGAYMDYDGSAYAQFGAKGSGGASLGVKIRTLLAGVVMTAATFAANASVSFASTLSASSGTDVAATIATTINQSGTASYVGLSVDVTQSATGSGTKLLMRARVGGTTKWSVDNAGAVTSGTINGQTISSTASFTGTMALTGDFAVNTSKFTVAASSGNTVVAGTLNVTGLITGTTLTLSSTSSTALSVAGAVSFTGASAAITTGMIGFSGTYGLLSVGKAGASYDWTLFDRGASTVVFGNPANTLNMEIPNGSIKTAAPTSGTAAQWKLGSRVAATVALVTTQYIELDVAGTLYKLATVA